MKSSHKTYQMKTKRHECDKCANFIDPEFKDPHNLISPVKVKAKCKLGNRVMFRMPIPYDTHIDLEKMGYFRYCNEFKTK